MYDKHTGKSVASNSIGFLDAHSEKSGHDSRFDQILCNLHNMIKDYQSHSDMDSQSNIRSGITENVADLVGIEFTAKEKELAVDILLSLLKQSEIDLRESLSTRLAAMPGVPQRVILQMAHDTISVAQHVLEHSPVLKDIDLVYIVKSKGKEHWRAIASRAQMTEYLVKTLAETKDETTATTLLKNTGVALPDMALAIFKKMAYTSDGVAEPLLKRPEVSAELAVDLYWHVSQALRTHILTNFKIPRRLLDDALQDVLSDFKDTAFGIQDYKPTRMMFEVANRYQSQDRISNGILMKTLRAGQGKFFMALLCARTGLDYETVFQMMRQVGGQSIAVTCKALQFSKEGFISTFLSCRSISRGDVIVDVKELRQAIKYFDNLSLSVAEEILDKSRPKPQNIPKT